MSLGAQAHDGSVGSGTATVQYDYETRADGSAASGDNAAEFVRLRKVTYPNGREVLYNHGSSGPWEWSRG